jgi:hypothetical protein
MISFLMTMGFVMVQGPPHEFPLVSTGHCGYSRIHGSDARDLNPAGNSLQARMPWVSPRFGEFVCATAPLGSATAAMKKPFQI